MRRQRNRRAGIRSRRRALVRCLFESFGRLAAGIDKGDAKVGTAKYLGRGEAYPEFEAKVEAVLQDVPPGSDPLLPKAAGGFWYST